MRHFLHLLDAAGWAAWAAWASALVSLLTLIAATWAGIVASRVYKIESARDQRAEEDRKLAAEDRRQAAEDRARAEQAHRDREDEKRRAQAALVSAWTGIGPEFGIRMRRGGLERGKIRDVWGAYVRNASELPVHGVAVTWFYVSHGTVTTNARGYVDLHVLPPSPEPQFVKCPDSVLQNVEDDPAEWLNAVSIEFTDAANVRWRREPNGALTEVKSAATEAEAAHPGEPA